MSVYQRKRGNLLFTEFKRDLVYLVCFKEKDLSTTSYWSRRYFTHYSYFPFDDCFEQKVAQFRNLSSAVTTLEKYKRSVPYLIADKEDSIQCRSVLWSELVIEKDNGQVSFRNIQDRPSCILFVGHGSLTSIEGVSTDLLYDFATFCGVCCVAFLGCDFGSSRKNQLLFYANSPDIRMITIAFDQKVSYEMVENSGILQGMCSFMTNIKSSSVIANKICFKRVFRFSIAAVKVFGKRTLNHVIFFNDGSGKLTTTETGLVVLQMIPLSQKELRERFSKLLTYHSWFSSKSSRIESSTNTINAVNKTLRTLCYNSEFFEGIQIVESGLKKFPIIELENVLTEVDQFILSSTTIKAICFGDWREIPLEDLAVGLSRGYRGTSTYSEMCKVFWDMLQRNMKIKESFKFIAAAWLSCDVHLHLKIGSSGDWYLLHTIYPHHGVGSLPKRFRFSPINFDELLPFYELHKYIQDCSGIWVPLFSRVSPSIYLGGKRSLLNVTLPVEGASKCQFTKLSALKEKEEVFKPYSIMCLEYNANEFNAALLSLSKFILSGEKESEVFDCKEFEENKRKMKMFNFEGNMFNFAESNVYRKTFNLNTFNSYNQCRFVLAYREVFPVPYIAGSPRKWEGALYFTDTHYGTLLLVNQPKGKSGKWDEVKDQLMQPFSSLGNSHSGKSPVEQAIEIAKERKYHPFVYCGKLTITQAVHPADVPNIRLEPGLTMFKRLHGHQM